MGGEMGKLCVGIHLPGLSGPSSFYSSNVMAKALETL